MADTIKVLSDHDVPATIIIVGVADTVSELIAEHRSIERAVVQIRMPRMDPAELIEILELGTDYAGMKITPEAAESIARLSQGFPHYSHLIGLRAGHVAIDRRSMTIERVDLKSAVEKAVSGAQESLLEDYRRAVSSPQPGNLFSRVLSACALAEHDRFGYSLHESPDAALRDHAGDIGRPHPQRQYLRSVTPPERPSTARRPALVS